MQSLKAVLFVQTILFFLCSPAVCWVGQISSRREMSATTTTSTNAGKLFYRNDNENDEFVSTFEISHALPKDALKPIDLPKHSPPANVIARTKMMLDVEMVIGRLAMVSFFLFLAGEVFTGLSSPQLLNALFLWQ